MRELFHLKGERQLINTVQEAFHIVRKKYPNAFKQGSLGAWSFFLPGATETHQMVAEMWMVQGRNPGWWLVVRGK